MPLDAVRRPSVTSQPSFDIVVVGSGGGSDETNLSAYLLKPTQLSWDDGIVALEAGSGQGALRELLNRNAHLFDDTQTYTAAKIYSFVRCFLITHAHLDHVNSLVLSAGSLGGGPKRIYALEQVLRDLEGIFAGRIWPNLVSWDENDQKCKLHYTPLNIDDHYAPTSLANLSVRTFPVSHGRNDLGLYDSSAFLIRNDCTDNELLFFGDVEPDSLSDIPRTVAIWKAVAPKIPHALHAVFIECSWPSARPDELLYGHLNPEHLAAELEVLAAEVVSHRTTANMNGHGKATAAAAGTPPRPSKKQRRNPVEKEDLEGALDGLTVYITHCKDDMDAQPGQPPGREVIVSQLKAIIDEKKLGPQIIAAEQGMKINV